MAADDSSGTLGRVPDLLPRVRLARVFREVAARIDGERLVGETVEGDPALAVEETVEVHAAAIAERSRRELGAAPDGPGKVPRILVGNGEPRVVLPAAAGRGGRATHLALLVARELAELPAPLRSRVAFLAAGTDDRDGNTDVSGAIVDGTTWERARARGLDPAAALRAYDSLPVLAAIGDTLRGPGTSNLLDLHLLHLP